MAIPARSLQSAVCGDRELETSSRPDGERISFQYRLLTVAARLVRSGSRDNDKKERQMRALIAAALAMTTSAAVADELADAHRLAISGRDTYWNCLAQEYQRDSNKNLSGQDFTLHIASVCPSERQNFRVSLVEYLAMQFPDVDSGAHMTTANNAISSAQQDVITAFVKHKASPK
jgi:hypothetical protein